jgi:hypothetical protein
MKTIMDVKRIPKKAWFTFRDVLSPIALSLRSDRQAGFGGEALPIEIWLANDRDETLDGCHLVYEIAHAGQVIASGTTPARSERCAPTAQGVLSVELPEVPSRSLLQVAASLIDLEGTCLHDAEIVLNVFPKIRPASVPVFVFGNQNLGASILETLEIEHWNGPIDEAKVILIPDASAYLAAPELVNNAVRHGATAILLSLPVGSHGIGSHTLEVRTAGMGSRHFVSCDTGHPLVAGFEREDFKFWFDENLGYASPILSTVLEAPGWNPILQSGDGGWGRPWGPVPVAAERTDGNGCWRICQLDLASRLKANPCAALFATRLLKSL